MPGLCGRVVPASPVATVRLVPTAFAWLAAVEWGPLWHNLGTNVRTFHT